MTFKTFLKGLFSVTYDKPFDSNLEQQIFQSFALKRAGQHLAINWICRGLVNAIHLNNCCFKRKGISYVLTPITGRRIIYSAANIDDSGVQGINNFVPSLPSVCPTNLFYSLEDQSINNYQVKQLEKIHSIARRKPFILIVLRDPANWLASSFSHGRSSRDFVIDKLDLFIEYLEIASRASDSSQERLVAINYNTFIADTSYRETLAKRLGINDFTRAEEALGITAKFGGGSSFKNDRKSKNTLERWKNYREDSGYRQALENPRLIDLSQKFFGSHLPGFEEMGLLR